MCKSISWGWLGLIAILMVQCVPVEEQDLTDIALTWQDSTQRKIYGFKDRGETDSLVRYFGHVDATYRYISALSFASVQDSVAMEPLIGLLQDPVDSVRMAAVIALGQLGNTKAEQALIQAFRAGDSTGVYDATNRHILEAVGKLGSVESLVNMATVQSYRPSDVQLLEGQAWGIYRYALRGIVDPRGTARMVDMLKASVYPASVQWIAAHYLYRAKGINLSKYTSNLIRSFRSQENPEIKMNLALALGKTKEQSARVVLTKELDRALDYRVKSNIVRALGNFDESVCGKVVFPLLKSNNEHIALTAANYFLKYGSPDHGTDYKEWAQDTAYSPVVRITLFAAAAHHLPFYYVLSFGGIRYRLHDWLNREKDPYIRVAIIRAMAEDPKNYPVILAKGMGDEHAAVRTESATALRRIFMSDKFDLVYGATGRWHRNKMIEGIHKAIQKGDVGVLAELVPVFETDIYDFRSQIASLAYLDTIRANLPLPRAIETYNIMGRVIAHLKGISFTPKTPSFNHPVDWDMFMKLKDTVHLRITTERGEMTIAMPKNDAPGTVLNFVRLTRNHYYDGKILHRVVSNFVIQDGCNRGDGYGALDYTIRSDLEHAYYHTAGVMGMASAGKDTECTQWFITHCSIPFLDGRYTAFGQLVSGWDTLHSLQVGDVIQSVVVLD